MSELNLPKRRLVYDSSQESFEEKINALSDAGYTMEHYGVDPGDGEVKTFFSAIMKLKSEAGEDFTGVEDIVILPIDNYVPGMIQGSPLIAKMIAEGWRIIEVYKGTKDTPNTAVMVKKKKEEKCPYGKITMEGKTWTLYDTIHLDGAKTLGEALNEMVAKGLAKEEKKHE